LNAFYDFGGKATRGTLGLGVGGMTILPTIGSLSDPETRFSFNAAAGIPFSFSPDRDRPRTPVSMNRSIADRFSATAALRQREIITGPRDLIREAECGASCRFIQGLAPLEDRPR
jgi:hypothetical protein